MGTFTHPVTVYTERMKVRERNKGFKNLLGERFSILVFLLRKKKGVLSVRCTVTVHHTEWETVIQSVCMLNLTCSQNRSFEFTCFSIQIRRISTDAQSCARRHAVPQPIRWLLMRQATSHWDDTVLTCVLVMFIISALWLHLTNQ